MSKIVFKFSVVLFLIFCIRVSSQINSQKISNSSGLLQNEIPLLVLPAKYSFTINSKKNGEIFHKQREKLNSKIFNTFSFRKSFFIDKIKDELCKKNNYKCDSYYLEKEYSKSFKIDSAYDFDIYIVTSKYGNCLSLISLNSKGILDVLNIHLKYIDYEGQESIYRNFYIDNRVNIYTYDYVYYEPIGEVDLKESKNFVLSSLKMIQNIYKLTNKGKFQKYDTFTVGTNVYPDVKNYLNIRLSPDISSQIIGSAYPKNKMFVVGLLDGWLKINLNGKIGYVCSDFVKNRDNGTD